MSDLGDLLELMHTASSRYNTVQARITQSTDSGLWYESARRWQAVMPKGSMEIIDLGYPPTKGSRTATTKRLWYADHGHRWRLESDHSLEVFDRGRWRTRSPDWEFANVRPDGTIDAHQQRALERFLAMVLDPSLLHAFSRVERVASTERLGRAAFGAEAVWRENIDLISVDWPYATSIEFVVDRDRGVLLDLHFKLDDEPFISWTVEDIAFDETFPESTFEV